MIGVALTLACSVVAAFYLICNDIFRLRGEAFLYSQVKNGADGSVWIVFVSG